mmetsp:Transcript_35584/g.34622  ORF Transcript_35584/g.34622 Transcript_35584/m.34622 type:complete len:87 (+) Transcript_35584:47-307(+)
MLSFLVATCLGRNFQLVHIESYNFETPSLLKIFQVSQNNSLLVVSEPGEFYPTQLGKAMVHLAETVWADLKFASSLRVVFEIGQNS